MRNADLSPLDARLEQQWTECLMFKMCCVDEVLGFALDVLGGNTPIVDSIVE